VSAKLGIELRAMEDARDPEPHRRTKSDARTAAIEFALLKSEDLARRGV